MSAADDLSGRHTVIAGRPHRWSGWPGAWCLDCGTDDPYERADAEGEIHYVFDPSEPNHPRMEIAPEVQARIDREMICREPGSKRHDPYAKHQRP